MIQAEPQHNVGPRPLAQSYHTGDSQVVQYRDETKSELKEGFKIEKKIHIERVGLLLEKKNSLHFIAD